MNKTVIAGVDVGKNGAITFIRMDLDSYATIDIPTFKIQTKKAIKIRNGFYKNGEKKYKIKTQAKHKIEIDFERIYNEFMHYESIHIFIEKQQCMPGNKTQACSSAMYNYGRLIQIIECLKYNGNDIEYTIVPPKEWKAYFGLSGSNYKDNKNVAVGKAKELGFSHKKARADLYESYLIARYGCYMFNKSNEADI